MGEWGDRPAEEASTVCLSACMLVILPPTHIYTSHTHTHSQIEHEWGEVKVDYGEGTSNRLAACNMDWDRLSAQDLYST